MNKIETRMTAERIFKLAKGYPPNGYPIKTPDDARKLDQIEEELKEFQRMVGLWVSNNI